MKNTKIPNSDYCLFYGLPGTVIFVISILATIKIGNDFDNDTMVRAGVFIGANALLWFTYLSFFIGLWHRLPIWNKFPKISGGISDCNSVEKNEEEIGEIMPAETITQLSILVEQEATEILSYNSKLSDEIILTDESQSQNCEEKFSLTKTNKIENMESNSNDETSKDDTKTPFEKISTNEIPIEGIPSIEIPAEGTMSENVSAEEISFKQITPQSSQSSQSTQIISDRYHEVLTAYEIERVAEKRRLVDSIIEYVCNTMPPFISPDELEKLCQEIRQWCDSPTYKPNEIKLRDRLSTNDLCHFIWNIGERLGRYNGYDGECRATYVKNLFATALSDVEVSSLRNMTKISSTDRIKLDRPKPDDNSFHYLVS